MNRRRSALHSLGLLALLGACSTPPQSLPSAQQLLAAAEQRLQNGSFQEALDTLDPLRGKGCPKRLRDRRDLAVARAELGIGQPWRAFLALEEFSQLYPHSELRSPAVEVIWTAGKQLVDSDGGFLFFWSDQRAGRAVLEHLITRHPDTQRLADALRILGDLAFADGDYQLAQDRYRDIILNRPESEWRFHAQFRFAMSIVRGLRGPDYDLHQMERAVRELRGFLNNQPEDPQMLVATNDAIQQVQQWQVERHLDIAQFYRTLASVDGERHHLKLATRSEYASVPAYALALAARQRFEQEHGPVEAGIDPVVPGGQPGEGRP